jgi:hypothetical protein
LVHTVGLREVAEDAVGIYHYFADNNAPTHAVVQTETIMTNQTTLLSQLDSSKPYAGNHIGPPLFR